MYFYIFLLLSYNLLGRQNDVKEGELDLKSENEGPRFSSQELCNVNNFLIFSEFSLLSTFFGEDLKSLWNHFIEYWYKTNTELLLVVLKYK